LAASRFTFSVRSFHVPPTPETTAWPPRRPSVPTSRATRVTSAANERSCSTMVLSVSFKSRISPRTSTVIFFDRSPFAIAVATSAMLRTCEVRLFAIELTLSVKSFHVPATPGHRRLAAELALGAHLAGDARHLGGERVQLVHHGVRGVLELQDLALHVHGDLAGEVAAGHGRGHLGDVAHLRGQGCWPWELTLSVRPFHVPATPCTCAWPPSLPSVPTSRATRVTSPANAFSWSTMVLMVSLS
jgi:hypothetical protein